MKIGTKEYWSFTDGKDSTVLVFKTEDSEKIYLNFISMYFSIDRWGYKKEENRMLNAKFL